MSYSQARLDIATVAQAIKTAWVAYPLLIETDNRDTIDLATQVNPFLQIDTVYLSGEQLELSEASKEVKYGQLIVTVVVKEGSGSATAATLLDFVESYFSRKDLSIVRLEVSHPQKMETVKGWCYFPLLFNFRWIK